MTDVAVTETVEICVDCVLAVSGYWEDAPSSWTGLLERFMKATFVATCDEHGNETSEFFSWRACDTCGSGLGGSRYEYRAFFDRENNE